MNLLEILQIATLRIYVQSTNIQLAAKLQLYHKSQFCKRYPLHATGFQFFWHLQNQYFPGTVGPVDNSGQHVVKYDDEDVETLNLNNEDW